MSGSNPASEPRGDELSDSLHGNEITPADTMKTPEAKTQEVEVLSPSDEDNTGGPSDEREDGGLLSWSNFIITIPNILIPLLYGYTIGFVGPYSTLYSYATNCGLYGSETSCVTLSAAKCAWITPPGGAPGDHVCGWADRTTCSLTYSTEAACAADSACVWKYDTGVCGNQVGYTSIQSGLFAGSMIMGGAAGSLLGGILTKRLDYRKSFFIIGLISIVAQVLTHVATGIFQYWLLFVSRIIIGFAMGWQTVAVPHYTDVFSPDRHKKVLGTLFQVVVCVGIFLAAVIAVCVGNTIHYNANSNANLMGRMQGFTALPTLLAVLVPFLPLVTKDGYSQPSPTAGGEKYKNVDTVEGNGMEASLAERDPAPAEGDDTATSAQGKRRDYTGAQMIAPILIGISMACTQQLTGINANMNFGPTILSNLGLDPLIGNLIMMAWNSVSAFGVIPLSRRFSMRTLFLATTLIGSLCCLFLGGIPVYPGVTKVKLAMEIIAIVGIFIFIAAFEMGIGPCFFVLAVDLYPKGFRPIGSSITMCVMFALNLVINICYPIATEGISGGPSGDPNKGQSVAFIFFGCIGLVTFVIEYFFLHPWEKQVTGVPGSKNLTANEREDGVASSNN